MRPQLSWGLFNICSHRYIRFILFSIPSKFALICTHILDLSGSRQISCKLAGLICNCNFQMSVSCHTTTHCWHVNNATSLAGPNNDSVSFGPQVSCLTFYCPDLQLMKLSITGYEDVLPSTNSMSQRWTQHGPVSSLMSHCSQGGSLVPASTTTHNRPTNKNNKKMTMTLPMPMTPTTPTTPPTPMPMMMRWHHQCQWQHQHCQHLQQRQPTRYVQHFPTATSPLTPHPSNDKMGWCKWQCQHCQHLWQWEPTRYVLHHPTATSLQTPPSLITGNETMQHLPPLLQATAHGEDCAC